MTYDEDDSDVQVLDEDARQEQEDAAVFDQWRPAIEEAVKVIAGLAERWPAGDHEWDALIGTLNYAARCLHVDRGRARVRLDKRSPVKVPSSGYLWRDQEKRRQADEDE